MTSPNRPISSFYTNKNILVTGSTGFLGGILALSLLEKVHSFSGKVICPVRNPRRLPQRLLSNPKLRVIEGFDLLLPNLGLDEKTRRYLVENVDIVFHCAAITSWMEPLAKLIRANSLATFELLELFGASNRIQMFMCCSTNAVDLPLIRENFGQPLPERIEPRQEGDSDEMFELAKEGKVPPNILDPKLPISNYAWSKHMMEQKLLRHYSNCKFPVVVSRIASVEGANSFPFRGYAHAEAGSGPAVIKMLTKSLRFAPEHFKNDKVDGMPVDMMANVMIVYPVYALSRSIPPEKFTTLAVGGSNRTNTIFKSSYVDSSSHYRGDPPKYFLTRDATLAAITEYAKNNKKEAEWAKMNRLIVIAYDLPTWDIVCDKVWAIRSWMEQEGIDEDGQFCVDLRKVDWSDLFATMSDMWREGQMDSALIRARL
ncbi:hypothetical protein HDU97_001534 [Phlyctochytrium planicorne]|nr:hypothetical protein HDU97_001534 [Phlyctochytrium planicorne]